MADLKQKRRAGEKSPEFWVMILRILEMFDPTSVSRQQLMDQMVTKFDVRENFSLGRLEELLESNLTEMADFFQTIKRAGGDKFGLKQRGRQELLKIHGQKFIQGDREEGGKRVEERSRSSWSDADKRGEKRREERGHRYRADQGQRSRADRVEENRSERGEYRAERGENRAERGENRAERVEGHRADRREEYRAERRGEFRAERRDESRFERKEDYHADRGVEYRSERKSEFHAERGEDYRAERSHRAVLGANSRGSADGKSRGHSLARRGHSPSRRGHSPARRGDSPSRRGHSPARRGDSPARRGDNPARRGHSPTRRGDSPTRRGDLGDSPARRGDRRRKAESESGCREDTEDRKRIKTPPEPSRLSSTSPQAVAPETPQARPIIIIPPGVPLSSLPAQLLTSLTQLSSPASIYPGGLGGMMMMNRPALPIQTAGFSEQITKIHPQTPIAFPQTTISPRPTISSTQKIATPTVAVSNEPIEIKVKLEVDPSESEMDFSQSKVNPAAKSEADPAHNLKVAKTQIQTVLPVKKEPEALSSILEKVSQGA